MAKFYCWRCKQTIERDSNKRFYLSYCDRTGHSVRLRRVPKRKKK